MCRFGRLETLFGCFIAEACVLKQIVQLVEERGLVAKPSKQRKPQVPRLLQAVMKNLPPAPATKAQLAAQRREWIAHDHFDLDPVEPKKQTDGS